MLSHTHFRLVRLNVCFASQQPTNALSRVSLAPELLSVSYCLLYVGAGSEVDHAEASGAVRFDMRCMYAIIFYFWQCSAVPHFTTLNILFSLIFQEFGSP